MTYRIRNISWKSALMALTIAGFTAITPSRASAQADVYVDDDLTRCLDTCSAKTKTLQCVSFDDFEQCLASVPECSSVVPTTSKEALGRFCRACGTGPRHCGGKTSGAVVRSTIVTTSDVETPAEPPKPETPAPPPKRVAPTPIAEPPPDTSDAGLCREKGGVYYRDEVDDASVEGGVKKVDHCITLRDAIDRIIQLERWKRMQRAGTADALGPAELERLSKVEDTLETMCPTIEKEPDVTLAQRCLALLVRLQAVEEDVKAVQAEVKVVKTVATDAKKDAARANKRLDNLKVPEPASKTPQPPLDFTVTPKDTDPYPHLRLSAILTGHFMKSPVSDDPLWGPGVEASWLPKLTKDLRLDFVAGAGVSAEDVQGDRRPVVWVGAGLAGFLGHGDFLLEGLGYAEHWYDTDERSLVNFYGVGGGLTWMHGASKRKGSSIVPAIGIRIIAGSTRVDDPNGGIRSTIDASGTVHVGFAF